MSRSPLGDRFEHICRDRSHAIAITAAATGVVTTFGQLAAGSASIHRAMIEIGVEPGDAILSLLGGAPLFFSLFVACLDAGAALVPLDEATDAEVLALIERSGVRAIVTDRHLPLATAVEREVAPGVWLRRLSEKSRRRNYPGSVVLKLTSGSTDLPKAALASADNMINDGRHIIDAMGIAPDDVNYSCLPLSHSYALGNVVMPLIWQGTRVALRQPFSPAHFIRDAADAGATVFPGVPFAFERIRTLPGLDRLPATLRLLITAGARIDPLTVRWFKDRLDRKVHSFYGSSETGGIAYDASDEIEEPLNVGMAMPETTVTIRDREDTAPAGRIFVAGNAVASGYAEDRGAMTKFVDGGFLTGDLGYRDEAGRLVLLGRVSNLVNVAGRKVDPSEVERRLLELPGITDAHVCGVECDTRGQEVVAFVVCPSQALAPVAIRQLCAQTLSAHKIPRRFVFVDALPVDARGKLDRQALALLAAAERAPRSAETPDL